LVLVVLLAAAAVGAAEGAAGRTDASPATGAAASPATTPPPAAAPADAAKKPAEPQPPVRISADAAEYFNKEGLVVFTGNVVAVQADATLSADRMEVYFEKPAAAPEKSPAAIPAPSGSQRMSRIVASDKVNFRQVDPESKKERYATGDKGVYDVEQRVVTMSGSPRLWEGKNVIVGEEMVFHLADKKVNVKGKVNLTVFPDELKEGKKP
jgi:lipopolysaccharide export system protein LptA